MPISGGLFVNRTRRLFFLHSCFQLIFANLAGFERSILSHNNGVRKLDSFTLAKNILGNVARP